MIIPSIDIMGGKAVQLRQGRELVLTSDRDPIDLVREYNRYGPVAVVDLDAALGQGNNRKLIQEICRVAEVRVGGGIRDEAIARDFLRAGASQLVIGTAATPELLSKFPREKMIVALDHRDGRVVDHGWTIITSETVVERGRRLAPFCTEFLCTFVKKEGMLEGIPLDDVSALIQIFPDNRITIAGGVANTQEAITLLKLGTNVQVGMSLYTGKLDLADVVAGMVDFEKISLVPTIVQDESGQVLMLAYSSRGSLLRALREGIGIYFSRSRNEVWEKGVTSEILNSLFRVVMIVTAMHFFLWCDRMVLCVTREDIVVSDRSINIFLSDIFLKPYEIGLQKIIRLLTPFVSLETMSLS
ncbi:MAG: hypothetical protein HZA36_03460 [Parcubacteria group bacterium]|nr:hypothetical protein [Parcubacteria group bacterium]